jgi:hypothetical protein
MMFMRSGEQLSGVRTDQMKDAAMNWSLDIETIKELVDHSIRNGGASKHHITRLAMYKALSGKWKDLDHKTKRCLAISKSSSLGRLLGLSEVAYQEANYPEVNVLDLSSFKDFDFCVSDQVFEHIEGNPFAAFQQTVNVLKTGGLLCHTTCLINPIHGVPKDFWRFTPDALKLLATESGCDLVEVGSWGNREAWGLVELGFRFRKLPVDEEHPLHKLAMRNEPKWPIVTWVLARKR